MTNRKLIRPSLSDFKQHPATHPSRHREGPPDETFAEFYYLLKQKEVKTPMVVKMLDGEIIRGWIEYFDRKCIKINRNDGPNIFIRKENIKYLHKDEETGEQRNKQTRDNSE